MPRSWPHRFDSAEDVPDVAKIYRKALAGEKDGSVVLIYRRATHKRSRPAPEQAGRAQSDLSGKDLVKKKSPNLGSAWAANSRKAAKQISSHDGPAAYEAIQNWPGTIVFSGWEIGQQIITGRAYAKVKGPHAAKRAYFLFNKWQGRQSWDQTAVLYAGRGLDGGLDAVWDLSPPGRMVIEKDGENGWQAEEGGPHRYLVEKMTPVEVAEMIEGLMVGERRSN